MKKLSAFRAGFEKVAKTKKEMKQYFSKEEGLMFTDYYRYDDT